MVCLIQILLEVCRHMRPTGCFSTIMEVIQATDWAEAKQRRKGLGSLREYLSRETGWLLAGLINRWARSYSDKSLLYRRTRLITSFGSLIFKRQINSVAQNFTRAFPGWNKAMARKAAAEGVLNLARGFADLCHWAAWPRLLSQSLRIQGAEHLERALDEERGVILATAHVGVFPFTIVPLEQRSLPRGSVIKLLEDNRFHKLYESFRERLGIHSVPAVPATRHLKKALSLLRAGGGILYTFDLPPGKQAAERVEFMGRTTPMFSGFVRISARFSVPLLPCYAVREPDGNTHRVVFSPPLEVPSRADRKKKEAQRVLQRLASWLERVVRDHPEQWWGWIHERD